MLIGKEEIRKMTDVIPCAMEDTKLVHTTGNVVILPAKILERPDIAMVVTASPGCILGVYHTVRKLGKTGQLFWCVMHPEEYSEKGEQRLRDVLARAAATPGVNGVVVYASCIEYMLGYDFDRVTGSFYNPRGVPVKVLMRGPVVPGMMKSMDYLQKLLDDIPAGPGRIKRINTDPLPEMPDFIRTADTLQDCPEEETWPILIEAGGCTKCLERPDQEKRGYRLRKTRLAAGKTQAYWNESILKGVLKEIETHPEIRQIDLIGSTIQELLQFSLEELRAELERRGLLVRLHFADGYH